MNLYSKKSSLAAGILKKCLPALLLVLICVVFVSAVNHTSSDTISREKTALENALVKGSVYTYSLSGRYPQSLAELVDNYGITYDHSRFVVEYVPGAENLLPQITVITLKKGKGAVR